MNLDYLEVQGLTAIVCGLHHLTLGGDLFPSADREDPMLRYVARRLLVMVPTLLIISILVFIVIQLPPGDYVSVLLVAFEETGIDRRGVEALRAQYGLDQPLPQQYLRWIGGMITRGDFGYSFLYNRAVEELIWERLALTVAVSLSALLLTWTVALPIGIVSAVRQYGPLDTVATVIAFIGLAAPNFLLALLLMYAGFAVFGQSVGGLFSPAYADAPWSMGKVADLLAHLWVPAVVVGTAGAAGLVRITRANLLDEIGRAYVTTARAKGARERRVLLRYPVRIALNPFVSSLAWLLPTLVSGETVASIVLNLPTTGPLLFEALIAQDMYLAGSILLLLSLLTVINTLISDLLLVALDPRIRFS